MQWADVGLGALSVDEQCRTCNALCCRYFCFQIDAPGTFEEFDDIRWYLLHEGITVHIDEGDWYISIENPCKALGPDKRCKIYKDRPLICRNYSLVNCDQALGDYEYDALFKTPEDIEEYARKILGAAEYERAKAQARAKARGKGTKKKVRSKA
jgi:Fe-S-cluster containining protein